ncbi:Tetratricopeptide-like helical [Penicillium macrosclerotiorum]|uniref:Tetratricopeptide-like helical n=1 Tax=Penicillium macrosclerotiorum TaxID=303699 RepID=UPI002549A099|nr:Tetratricopeptide-like helical [Penicillium macrosclerotiorum]KAJ5692033.1 Tetratricopeptide-like helical [Penicillium macrosclerotiorum]
MARVSDLIRDSKLETHFLPDHTVETVHTFQESDPQSRRRLVTRTEHWRRERSPIGQGGFGSVWLERRTKGGPSGATVQEGAVRAVKQINMNSQHGSIDLDRELEAIAKFSHPRYERCFVKSFGWYNEGPAKLKLFIAMEYLELGDLSTYLNHRPPLPEFEARILADQILDGLCMMHENKFAHRDLKPQNILIRSHPPDEWWIKLADFGITKRIEEDHGQVSTVKGTPKYCAPEIWGFIERGTAYALDMWALGEIVFEMLTKKPTFANPGILANYLKEQNFPVSLLTNVGVNQSCIDFVLSLMQPHPEDRITASSAMSSVWIQSSILYPTTSRMAASSEIEPHVPNSAVILTEEFASWSTSPLSIINQGQVDTQEPYPAILTAQFSAGYALCQQDQYKEAEPLFRQALEGREKVLGLDHKDTLFSIYWLGRCLYQQGQYEEAEPLFRQALEGREKVLGLDHKDTLSSIHDFGLCLFEQDKNEEAESLFRRALEGREKVLGLDHKDTLFSIYCLGCCLYQQGQYKEAESLFRRALEGREKVLRLDHKDTLFSICWLGHCLFEQGQYQEAEPLFRQALEGREKVLGLDHEDTLPSIYWLSLCLFKQGQYQEAEPLFRQALKRREKVLGLDHEDTLLSIYWLSLCLFEQGQYQEAEPLFRQALEGREKVLGLDHKDTLFSICWLGRCLYQQDKYEEAESLFRRL